jgi:hypothetical protein
MPQRAAQRIIWLCALPLLAACSAPPGSGNQPPGTASPEGTLVVSWQPSKKNTDGTPLTDLSGYTIYYGTKPGDYSQKQTIDDPSATHAVIRGLKPGLHYYVAISANNKAGRQSELSPATHR